MTCYVAPVAEGQTEQAYVERLLQRVWAEVLCRTGTDRLQVMPVVRGPRDQLIDPNGVALATKVGEAVRQLVRARKPPDHRSLVLILLDAEDRLPCQLAPALLAVARSAVTAAVPVACVLPTRMFENWIVAGCSTLAGVGGLPPGLTAPADPEACHGANWLDARIRQGKSNRKYKKVASQTLDLVRQMHLPDCQALSPSFRKLCRDLLRHFPPPPPPDPATTPEPPTG